MSGISSTGSFDWIAALPNKTLHWPSGVSVVVQVVSSIVCRQQQAKPIAYKG